MSSQKNYILGLEPALFLTWDGDQVNEVSFVSNENPEMILDESGNGNNATVTNGSTVTKSYRLGMDPLPTVDVIDMHSVCVGYYGRTPADTELYPKCIFHVAHTDKYEFNDINGTGSFTLNFFWQKDSNEQDHRDYMYSVYETASPWGYDLTRPVVVKNGVFTIWFIDRWAFSSEILTLKTPGGSFDWEVPDWFYKTRSMLTLVWDVQKQTNDSYIGTMKFLVNGRLMQSATYNYSSLGSVPSAQNPSPIQIGGTEYAQDNVLRSYSDRQTSPCYFDQLALFPRALTDDEVASIWKKAHSYPNLCSLAQASMFYRMNDVYSATNNVLTDYMGKRNGTITGSVESSAIGPSAVYSASSMRFYGGTARVNYSTPGYWIPPFTMTGDWTIDGWWACTSNNRSVLLSIQGINQPYYGLVIELNRKGSADFPGMIQVSNSESYTTSSLSNDSTNVPYNFADGNFHHIAVVKSGTTLELWIDGIMHSSKTGVPEIDPDPKEPLQIQFMGSTPGNLETHGYMSSVGFYNYALQPQEIRWRNRYNVAWYIKGFVTLQGNPYQATVRAFDHLTGELVDDVVSDPSTGEYNIWFFDDKYIDIMAMNMQDINVRYRVYGPIAPVSVLDMPISN